MIFASKNKKVPLSKNEIVKVILHEGNTIFGIVEEVEDDVVWLRSSGEKNSTLLRLNFKIDEFIKLN
jgi:hypothetical protein